MSAPYLSRSPATGEAKTATSVRSPVADGGLDNGLVSNRAGRVFVVVVRVLSHDSSLSRLAAGRHQGCRIGRHVACWQV